MLTLEPPVTIDRLETELVALERHVAKVRARQLLLLRQLDEAQVVQTDGSRNLAEWTAARLDVEIDTARCMVAGTKVVAEYPDLGERLAAGQASFDRVMATGRLMASNADPDLVKASAGFDLAGVARLASRQRRMARGDERQVFRDRFFATQHSLDGTSGRLWGQLPGFELSILEDAIDTRADQFRDLPGPASPSGARRADALVSVAQDSLELTDPLSDRTPSHREPSVVVFADAALAGPTRGEAGSEFEFGPKVGPATLERILCSGRVQLVGLLNGEPVDASHATRAIPPATRRYVTWRDGGCTIDGCSSRYRLEPHHVVPWAKGGSHDARNLTTLCWFHHHVKIHGEGHRLDPDAPPGRRRLLPPTRGPDPPL